MAAAQFQVAWPAISLTNARGTEKVFGHGQKIPPSYLTPAQAAALADIGAIVQAVDRAKEQPEGKTKAQPAPEPDTTPTEGDTGSGAGQDDAAGDDD